MNNLLNNQNLLTWVNQSMSGGDQANDLKIKLMNSIKENQSFTDYNKWLYQNFIQQSTSGNAGNAAIAGNGGNVLMGSNWLANYALDGMELEVEFFPFLRQFALQNIDLQNVVIQGL
jgi:glucuronate isomerase